MRHCRCSPASCWHCVGQCPTMMQVSGCVDGAVWCGLADAWRNGQEVLWLLARASAQKCRKRLSISLPGLTDQAGSTGWRAARLGCSSYQTCPLHSFPLTAQTPCVPLAAGVATHAVGCVHVLGVNLPPRHWMALSIEAVAAEQQSTPQRTAALVVLSALLHAASKAGAAVESESLQLAADTLSSSELAAAALAADGSALRLQLLAACFNLVRWAGPGSAAVASQLFQLLLQLQAAEVDSLAQASAPEQAATAATTTAAAGAAAAAASSSSRPLTAAGVLAEMAAALGRASAADLCDMYGPAMLQRCVQVGHSGSLVCCWSVFCCANGAACCSAHGNLVTSAIWPASLLSASGVVSSSGLPPRLLQNHKHWTHTHPGWRTSAALLRLSGSGALLQLWPTVLPALQRVAADHERDPRLRLELLHLVAALLEDDSKAQAWPQAGVGQQLVAGVLVPALVWRAGRVPAAARYAALTALATLLARQRLPPALVAEVACASKASNASLPAGAEAVQEGSKPASLLAQMAGCLDEEYEPDTRQLACHALALLLDQGRLFRWAQLECEKRGARAVGRVEGRVVAVELCRF